MEPKASRNKAKKVGRAAGEVHQVLDFPNPKRPAAVVHDAPSAPVTAASSSKDLRTLFDMDHAAASTLKAALIAFGFKASSTDKKEDLKQKLRAARNGDDPIRLELEKEWNLRQPSGAIWKDQTDGGTPNVPGGLTQNHRDTASRLSTNEASAYFFRKIISNAWVEEIRQRCIEKYRIPEGVNLEKLDLLDHDRLETHECEHEIDDEDDFDPDNPFIANNDVPAEGRGPNDYSDWAQNVLFSPNLFLETFKKYIIVHLADCMEPTPAFEAQWTKRPGLRDIPRPSSLIRHILSRDHHRQFQSMLTIGPAGAPQQSSIDIINRALSECWVPKGHCVLDEMPIPFKGRGPVIIDRSKPNPSYIKIHGLADDDRAVIQIWPCFNPSETITTQFMLKESHLLLERNRLTHSAIIADSWYGSIKNADWLQKVGRRFCLSVKNRKGTPVLNAMAEKIEPNCSRFIGRRQPPGANSLSEATSIINPILLTSFKQSGRKKSRNPIFLLSNIAKAEIVTQGAISKPLIVRFYSERLGNIDRVDQSMLELESRRGHRSWKLKAINWFIHLAAHNAWVYFKDLHGSDISHTAFVNRLIWGLIGDDAERTEREIILALAVPLSRCSLEATEYRRACRVCGPKSRTKYMCSCENVYLHPACCAKWHDLDDRIDSLFGPAMSLRSALGGAWNLIRRIIAGYILIMVFLPLLLTFLL